MKWRGRRQSDNVVDRRGSGGGKTVVGGGLGRIVVLIFFILLGGDPQALRQQVQPNPHAAASAGEPLKLSETDRERGEFVAKILADSEDVWNQISRQSGLRYLGPKLELFS